MVVSLQTEQTSSTPARRTRDASERQKVYWCAELVAAVAAVVFGRHEDKQSPAVERKRPRAVKAPNVYRTLLWLATTMPNRVKRNSVVEMLQKMPVTGSSGSLLAALDKLLKTIDISESAVMIPTLLRDKCAFDAWELLIVAKILKASILGHSDLVEFYMTHIGLSANPSTSTTGTNTAPQTPLSPASTVPLPLSPAAEAVAAGATGGEPMQVQVASQSSSADSSKLTGSNSWFSASCSPPVRLRKLNACSDVGASVGAGVSLLAPAPLLAADALTSLDLANNNTSLSHEALEVAVPAQSPAQSPAQAPSAANLTLELVGRQAQLNSVSSYAGSGASSPRATIQNPQAGLYPQAETLAPSVGRSPAVADSGASVRLLLQIEQLKASVKHVTSLLTNVVELYKESVDNIAMA